MTSPQGGGAARHRKRVRYLVFGASLVLVLLALRYAPVGGDRASSDYQGSDYEGRSPDGESASEEGARDERKSRTRSKPASDGTTAPRGSAEPDADERGEADPDHYKRQSMFADEDGSDPTPSPAAFSSRRDLAERLAATGDGKLFDEAAADSELTLSVADGALKSQLKLGGDPSHDWPQKTLWIERGKGLVAHGSEIPFTDATPGAFRAIVYAEDPETGDRLVLFSEPAGNVDD